MSAAKDLCQQASAKLAQGKITEAIALSQKAIAKHPERADAYEILINSLNSQKRFAETIEPLKRVVQLKPHNIQLKFSLGGLLIQQGNLEQAAELFRAILQIDPNTASAYCGLGVVLAQQKQQERAIHHFESALQIQPRYFEALSNLGNLLIQQNRLDEAVLAFEKAININPQNANIIGKLGLGLERQGKVDEALACYRHAIQAQPSYLPAYIDQINLLTKLERLTEAIEPSRKAIQLQPDNIQLKCNLGGLLTKQDELLEASEIFQAVLISSPKHVKALCGLGIVLIKQNRPQEAILNFEAALQIEPQHFDSLLYFGVVLTSQNQLDQAIAKFQIARKINPQDAELNYRIGLALIQKNMHARAISYLQKSLDTEPKLATYSNLIDSLRTLIHSRDHFHLSAKVGELLQKNVAKYNQFWLDQNFVRSVITSLFAYLNSGTQSDVLMSKFLELEQYIYDRTEQLSQDDITQLYYSLLFIMFSIRDDQVANTKLARLLGDLYANKVIKPKLNIQGHNPNSIEENISNSIIEEPRRKEHLRIGILHGHMHRNPVSWCSVDVIQALAQITPYIYLYATENSTTDDLTQRFEQITTNIYLGKHPTSTTASTSMGMADVLAQITSDRLDILLDLDSITEPNNVVILYGKPATATLSWLGFDAPYVSSSNYFLGDRHTHPEVNDRYYTEQIIRLPDSHMAVTEFTCDPVNRDEMRKSLGIETSQIAYLYNCHIRKLNSASVRAQVQILKQVPDSVLLRKGYGDSEFVKQIYSTECDRQGICSDRVKYLPLMHSEEEHRVAYLLADVGLDSYPYNGGSQNIEALWFNLPIITLVGEQSFARMGYSFLQTLDISAGIAHNWEEYVEWGIKFGLDTELRNSVRSQLIRSKQLETLSPLWNPTKLAKDMYTIFEQLVAKTIHSNHSQQNA